jgi:formate hydrogenlyase subunit 4
MDRNVVGMILGGLVNVAIALLVAPFFQGVLRRVTARVIQSRQGPPLMQPYFDIFKLLGKEDIESGETPGMQRFATYLLLATVLAATCLVPLGFPAPMSGSGDVVLLVYLITFSGICTLLAGAAAGSTYSLVGTSREMMMMIALDPIFAITLVVGALNAKSLRLESVLNGSVYSSGAFPFAGILLLGVMLLAFQAYVGRVPFDISEAETEIMEGPLIEYSGPKLAMFKYAQAIKLVLYAALFVALFIPWGNSLPFPIAFLIFWAKVLVLVLLSTVLAATHARYRIDQALRYYATFLAVSLVAVVLASFGH